MREVIRWFLAALLVLGPLLSGGPVRADETTTVTTSSADSYLNQVNTTANYGALTTMNVRSRSLGRNRRAIVQFSLATVPAGSAAKLAVMQLWLATVPGASRSHEIRLVTGAVPWTEAGVTWTRRNGAANLWTAGGGDFDPQAIDTQATETARNVWRYWNILGDGTVANIPQRWLDTPSTNLGVTVKDATENSGTSYQGVYQSRTGANHPQLVVHYLRDVTLGSSTADISSVTHTWTFPSGSTSGNYDGVLFTKLQGGTAPGQTPADGTAYQVGNLLGGTDAVAINTSSFTTVAATDENGASSVVLPGTAYTYKAFTHDNTAIAGAGAFTLAAPHYAKGVASSTVTTLTGGGATKNWSYRPAATTLAAPALDPGVVVVTGGNDNRIHSMSPTTGVRNFQPGGVIGVTGGAIQTRPSLIAASDTSQPTCKNVCDVVYATSGDGYVYAFRTDTSALLWQSALLTTGAGSGLQGAAAVQVKSYSGASYTLGYDLVIVGTRNVGSQTNNKIYGLNGNTGATVWTANTGSLDIVNTTPYVDYANNVAWVTSRSNSGAQASLWKIDTITGSLLASFNLGDVDQSPSLDIDGLVVFVLSNSGNIVAVRTDLANCSTSFALPGAAVPVGFPIPMITTTYNDDVYFSTTTNVRKVHFAYGPTCTESFADAPGGWTNPAIASPSAPIFSPSPLALYVGSSDGHLYKISLSTGGMLANRLINTGATVGDPSFDTVISKFYVGDSSGRIYSFDLF